MQADQCPRCGSGDFRSVEMPEGHTHFSKLVCGRCKRFVRWLAAPGIASEPSAEVRALIHPRRLPAPLADGTAAQKRAGGAARFAILHRIEKAGRPDLRRLVLCIRDSTWFIANHDRAVESIRWPSAEQMERPRPTGACPCGDPCYDFEPYCSEECASGAHAESLINP